MQARLRRRSVEHGIPVSVLHQRMEALNLPRRYRAIFLAGPIFTLLPDDATALRRIRAHLADEGTALVPLFTPAPTPAEQIGRVRTRYERHNGSERNIVERPWVLHWYPCDAFRELATAPPPAPPTCTSGSKPPLDPWDGPRSGRQTG